MSITLKYKKAQNINYNDVIISDHSCYILLSLNNNKFYIGYTTDFKRRLRQHNGEIVGGAKKTKKWRPWIPLCQITGFFDKSCALRFEYRLQHQKKKKKSENLISYILNILTVLLYNKDGSKINNSCIDWPILTIQWYTNLYHIYHPNIINIYRIVVK
jgi:predicted GIY-YIG superfamily endonuclease